MTESQKLARLAEMQKLRERKCEGGVVKARTHAETTSKEAERLTQLRDFAEDELTAVMTSPTFCPDRMTLVMGQVSIADNALAIGTEALSNAQLQVRETHSAWEEARFRSDHISERARTARRKQDRKRDDASLAERLSMRAAMSRESKT